METETQWDCRIIANEFKTCIERYINQSTRKTKVNDQQWDVMHLRKEVLNPDILNAIKFKLTTRNAKHNAPHDTVTVDASMRQSFVNTIINTDE